MCQAGRRNAGRFMSEFDSHRQLETLLSRLADPGLNEAEFQELGELIGSRPEFRRQYLEHCQMHGLLRAEHGLLASWSDFAEENPSTLPRLAGHGFSRRSRRAL